MTILETSIQNGTTRVCRVISLSPEALRACADTLENLANNGCAPGDSVLYPLTHGITVLYKPEPNRRYEQITATPINDADMFRRASLQEGLLNT